MQVNIPVEYVAPLIRCPRCKTEFVLIYAFFSEDGGRLTMQQDACDWCPFCGEDLTEWQKEERRLAIAAIVDQRGG